MMAALILGKPEQDNLPEGWAAEVLSAAQRLLPQTRRNLPLTTFLFRNWRRTVVRVRAMPLSPLAVQGLAGLAISRDRYDIAAVLLLGFVALLRSGKVLNLRFDDIILCHWVLLPGL